MLVKMTCPQCGASLGFEEVTEAYNAEDDEILAVLKLSENP